MNLKKYFKEIEKYPRLSRKEEVVLARRAERGNEKAREKLICSHLNLVVYISNNYFNKYELSIGEKICAGNEGLLRAFETYDWRKGKLVNYAFPYIRNKITKAISESNILGKNYTADKVKKAYFRLVKDFCREPTIEELSKEIKENPLETNLFLESAKKPLSIEEISDVLESEEAEIQSNKNLELNKYKPQLLNSFLTIIPEEILKRKTEGERIHEALDKLPPREKDLIMRNFGMGEYECQSMVDISRIFNISKSRAGQIRDNGLRKLKIILLKENI